MIIRNRLESRFHVSANRLTTYIHSLRFPCRTEFTSSDDKSNEKKMLLPRSEGFRAIKERSIVVNGNES